MCHTCPDIRMSKIKTGPNVGEVMKGLRDSLIAGGNVEW
jgi:hypothetical protein